MAHLLTFPNSPTIGHMSAAARKQIIIIQAKYLMFPLSEQVYKQMRHLPFIVRRITGRFPTARPDLATSRSAGREPAEGPDHRDADKHTLGPPLQGHMSMWCPFDVLKCVDCLGLRKPERIRMFRWEFNPCKPGNRGTADVGGAGLKAPTV